jgi:hypothetical protein
MNKAGQRRTSSDHYQSDTKTVTQSNGHLNEAMSRQEAERLTTQIEKAFGPMEPEAKMKSLGNHKPKRFSLMTLGNDYSEIPEYDILRPKVHNKNSAVIDKEAVDKPSKEEFVSNPTVTITNEEADSSQHKRWARFMQVDMIEYVEVTPETNDNEEQREERESPLTRCVWRSIHFSGGRINAYSDHQYKELLNKMKDYHEVQKAIARSAKEQGDEAIEPPQSVKVIEYDKLNHEIKRYNVPIRARKQESNGSQVDKTDANVNKVPLASSEDFETETESSESSGRTSSLSLESLDSEGSLPSIMTISTQETKNSKTQNKESTLQPYEHQIERIKNPTVQEPKVQMGKFPTKAALKIMPETLSERRRLKPYPVRLSNPCYNSKTGESEVKIVCIGQIMYHVADDYELERRLEICEWIALKQHIRHFVEQYLTSDIGQKREPLTKVKVITFRNKEVILKEEIPVWPTTRVESQTTKNPKILNYMKYLGRTSALLQITLANLWDNNPNNHANRTDQSQELEESKKVEVAMITKEESVEDPSPNNEINNGHMESLVDTQIVAFVGPRIFPIWTDEDFEPIIILAESEALQQHLRLFAMEILRLSIYHEYPPMTEITLQVSQKGEVQCLRQVIIWPPEYIKTKSYEDPGIKDYLSTIAECKPKRLSLKQITELWDQDPRYHKSIDIPCDVAVQTVEVGTIEASDQPSESIGALGKATAREYETFRKKPRVTEYEYYTLEPSLFKDKNIKVNVLLNQEKKVITSNEELNELWKLSENNAITEHLKRFEESYTAEGRSYPKIPELCYTEQVMDCLQIEVTKDGAIQEAIHQWIWPPKNARHLSTVNTEVRTKLEEIARKHHLRLDKVVGRWNKCFYNTFTGRRSPCYTVSFDAKDENR